LIRGSLTAQADNANWTVATSWHARLALMARRKCLLFTHDQTLFSLLRCGLTRPDFTQPEHTFSQGLFKPLLQFDFEQAGIEQMLEQTRAIRWTNSHTRSVAGSMNNIPQLLKWSVHQNGGPANADQADRNRLLNTPSQAIGYGVPIDRLGLAQQ
jgi:hypothetical protein